MNFSRGIRVALLLAIAFGAVGGITAQTTEQTVNVRILPTTTVEEKVANEAKEKQLRKDEFRVVRVSSWIVSVRSRNKDDPRNHTKQHERNTSDWRAGSDF
jgi:hypothetical protein